VRLSVKHVKDYETSHPTLSRFFPSEIFLESENNTYIMLLGFEK